MIQQKNKMVSFRLSDEEYVRLREHCEVIGARNLSEMARIAMQRLIDMPDGKQHAISEQVCELRVKVRDLSSEVERISHLVEHSNGADA